MPHEPSTTPFAPLAVPFDDVAAFTRKLIHDVRNGLNALDLQLASMFDGIEGIDGPLRDDLTLARRLLNNEARRLVEISAQFRSPTPQIITYLATDLIEDMRARIERTLGAGAPPIGWTIAVTRERVEVDFEMLSAVVVELVRNAVQFREGDAPLKARAAAEGGVFVIELRESRAAIASDPAVWGTVPFASTRRGGYGLGLFAARRTLTTLGGSLGIGHDAGRRELCSRLTLPLATP